GRPNLERIGLAEHRRTVLRQAPRRSALGRVPAPRRGSARATCEDRLHDERAGRAATPRRLTCTHTQAKKGTDEKRGRGGVEFPGFSGHSAAEGCELTRTLPVHQDLRTALWPLFPVVVPRPPHEDCRKTER